MQKGTTVEDFPISYCPPTDQTPVLLSDNDRKTLLLASFRLFARRLYHGIPVTASDLIRVAAYADGEIVA